MNGPEPSIRRILVALDSSTTATHGLEAATGLARRLRAELQGLFVEDDELLQVAALPFTTQVNMTTGGRQPLEISELESQMARLAEAARRRLAAAAKRDRIAWSFRTVRGRIAQEVASAAEGSDLVIIQGGRQGGPAHARLGLPASATVNRVTRSVLILRDGNRVEGRIFVVFDGTAQSEKALRMAMALAHDSNALTILLSENTAQNPVELEARAHAVLGETGKTARMEHLPATTLAELCAHIGKQESGLVVMNAENPMLSNGDIANLLDPITCTVLLVR
jgi:nucleotide-binding universal stress UspA family protein